MAYGSAVQVTELRDPHVSEIVTKCIAGLRGARSVPKDVGIAVQLPFARVCLPAACPGAHGSKNRSGPRVAMSPDKPRLGFNRAALRRSIGIVRSFEPPSVDAERVAEIGRKSVFLDGLKWRRCPSTDQGSRWRGCRRTPHKMRICFIESSLSSIRMYKATPGYDREQCPGSHGSGNGRVSRP